MKTVYTESGERVNGMNKEDIRLLVKQLTEVVKHRPVVYQAIDNIEAKFDVLSYSSQPFKAAVKVWDTELIRYLIDRGALDAPLAVKSLADKADGPGVKKFEGIEAEYLGLLEYALAALVVRHGDRETVDGIYFDELYLPYIHYAVLSGDTAKLGNFCLRFGLLPQRVCAAVKTPILLMLVSRDGFDMLKWIEAYRDWVSEEALSQAVGIEGEGALKAVVYLLARKPDLKPSLPAAAKALYRGCFDILDVIYPSADAFPKSPTFLVEAANAYPYRGAQPLEYLFKRGYTPDDRLPDGRSLLAYAESRHDAGLIAYLTSLGVK